MHPGEPQTPQWALLVEEMKSRNAAWYVSLVQPVGHDLAQARAAARHLALTHRPRLGGSKKQRDVFQVGEDVWIIAYSGSILVAGSAYFKVSVVRHVASEPG
ncbi:MULTISPECIES: hypothetical protein [Thermomonosporaceae]|uniref:hypothetical protein n=1 Tax=Thermomonosporaceae TaxID=2012 RepID=UPI00255A8AA1|nr:MULTISPECIES: hypothetical protein [Thermomonosporaceae]MDL4772374.1 hypothetical protein [Actinomadura xylanilytica]